MASFGGRRNPKGKNFLHKTLFAISHPGLAPSGLVPSSPSARQLFSPKRKTSRKTTNPFFCMESESSTPQNNSRKQDAKIGQLIKASEAIAVEISHLEYDKEKWLKEMKVLENKIRSRIRDSEKLNVEIRKDRVVDKIHVVSSLDKVDVVGMKIVHSLGNSDQGETIDRHCIHGAFASSSKCNFSLSLRENSTAEMCIIGSSREKMSTYLINNHIYQGESLMYIGSEEDPCFLRPKETVSCQEDNLFAASVMPSVTFTTKAMKYCLVSEEQTHHLPSFDEEKDLSIVDTCLWNDDGNFCHQDLPEMRWSNVSSGDYETMKCSPVSEEQTHVSPLHDEQTIDTCDWIEDENLCHQDLPEMRQSNVSLDDHEAMKHTSRSVEQTHVSSLFDEEKDPSIVDTFVQNDDENCWHQGLPAIRWSNISLDDCEAMKYSSVPEEQTLVSSSFNEEEGLLILDTCVPIDDENFCHQGLSDVRWNKISLGDSEILSENKESNRRSKPIEEFENIRESKAKFEMEHNTLVKEKEVVENELVVSKKSLEDAQSHISEPERLKLQRKTNNSKNVLEEPSSELSNLRMDVLEFDYRGGKTILEKAIKNVNLLDRERESLMLDLANHQKTFLKAYEDYILLEKERDRLQRSLNECESNLDTKSCENMSIKSEKGDIEETFNVLVDEYEKNSEHRGLANYEAMELEREQKMVCIEKESHDKLYDLLMVGLARGAIMEEMERKNSMIKELEKELIVVKTELGNLTRMFQGEKGEKSDVMEKLHFENGRNRTLEVLLESVKPEWNKHLVEIEDGKMMKETALEDIESMESHMQSLEDNFKRLNTGMSRDEKMALPEDPNSVEIMLMKKEDFDVEGCTEEDKYLLGLLETCLSFEVQSVKAPPCSTPHVASEDIDIRKGIMSITSVFDSQHMNISEIVSCLVEIEVLKRVVMEHNVVIPTSSATVVNKAHVFSPFATISTAALAPLVLFLLAFFELPLQRLT